MRVSDLIPWRATQPSMPDRPRDQDAVAALQGDINRAFENFMRMFPLPLASWPRELVEGGGFQLDVEENDKEIRVTAELPGIEEGDIDIRVSDGMLTITGEKKTDREADDSGYILRERRFGRVERTLPLPEGIDTEATQATFKNGVLTVILPKTNQDQGAAKQIPVQTH